MIYSDPLHVQRLFQLSSSVKSSLGSRKRPIYLFTIYVRLWVVLLKRRYINVQYEWMNEWITVLYNTSCYQCETAVFCVCFFRSDLQKVVEDLQKENGSYKSEYDFCASRIHCRIVNYEPLTPLKLLKANYYGLLFIIEMINYNLLKIKHFVCCCCINTRKQKWLKQKKW